MAAETDPVVLVLASLAEGPKHGYGITRDIADTMSITLGPGTLYGVLARLEAGGLIKALPAQGRRRPYQITAAGQRVLAEQVDLMHRIAEVGMRRLAAAGATS